MRKPATALMLCLALAGCARVPPPVTEAEGTIYLDNMPLPKAYIQFIPDLQYFGAEMNSTAISDDKGHFTLNCAQNDQPGACVAKHRVVVIDAPGPKETRGMDAKAQQAMADYLGSLKNRPIPDWYKSVGQTPLIVEVTKDQKTYDLHLNRKKP